MSSDQQVPQSEQQQQQQQQQLAKEDSGSAALSQQQQPVVTSNTSTGVSAATPPPNNIETTGIGSTGKASNNNGGGSHPLNGGDGVTSREGSILPPPLSPKSPTDVNGGGSGGGGGAGSGSAPVTPNTTGQEDGHDPGKMFIGGLSWSTTAEGLRDYFCRFGEVNECMVMRDPATKRARGFGFITFVDPASVVKVLDVEEHELDGKKIDPKVAYPKRSQTKMVVKTKKVFIGGLSATSTLDDMKTYFEQYGKVEDAMLMFDKATQRHRGFGFITFDSDDVADRVCEIHFHEVNGKMVECKKAQPKEVMLPVTLNKTRAAAARNFYGMSPEQLLAYATYMPRLGAYGNVIYPAATTSVGFNSFAGANPYNNPFTAAAAAAALSAISSGPRHAAAGVPAAPTHAGAGPTANPTADMFGFGMAAQAAVAQSYANAAASQDPFANGMYMTAAGAHAQQPQGGFHHKV